MPKCANWQPKPGLEEQCRLAVVKLINNCGNCKHWSPEGGKCNYD